MDKTFLAYAMVIGALTMTTTCAMDSYRSTPPTVEEAAKLMASIKRLEQLARDYIASTGIELTSHQIDSVELSPDEELHEGNNI